MKKLSKLEKRLSLALIFVLAIAIFEGVLLTYQVSRTMPQFNQTKRNISSFVYNHLDNASYSLENYVQSKSEADLFKATDAIGKAAAVGASLKDSTIYQNPTDTADNTIKIWGTLFLIQTYEYLENILNTGVDKTNLEVIELLSETFQPLPDSGDHVTFMSLYWNASSSGLANLPEWSAIVHYDDSILQWPDF